MSCRKVITPEKSLIFSVHRPALPAGRCFILSPRVGGGKNKNFNYFET
ncbi:MAG: hypothetical protein LBR79_02650 [Oscillospiraceae bacterium]|nr:hypothetical protein [Oscillospiraceae bacterium]